QNHLVLDPARQAAVDEKIGVEIALPIVPESRRIALELRHGDAGAFEHLGCFAVVVARRPVDELKHILRDAKISEHRANHPFYRRKRADAIENWGGDKAEPARID